jgi:signal transduction histidine kinase
MGQRLRALLVEDNERDAALVVRALRQGGYDLDYERVETPEALTTALERGGWDVVLSDFHLPRLSAPKALALVKGQGLDLPFIIISGTIGEEAAVESLRAGAHDFLVKNSLARLQPAIERERREAQNRAERRSMHEQLLLSERMVSMGTLAAGLAHEINNPLAVLVANLEMATQQLDRRDEGAAPAADGDDELQRSIKAAYEAAERVRLIVRDVKLFSRAEDEERKSPVDIHAVLDSSIRMALNEIRHRARLTRDYGDVPPVAANESRLGQVFLNLLVNAAQAIPEGRAEANEIVVATRPVAGGRVAIEVRDTGSGISAENLSRIFEPMFTTKPVGIGTGLGLPICRRIVNEAGGTIEVESEIGIGSVFRVVLPRAEAPSAAERPAAAAPAATGRGRVLVVDDEPTLCDAISRMLAADHEVSTTTEAQEALRRIEGGERFDVIFCDLMMPQMTGIELHEALTRVAPDQAQKMVFITGGAFTPTARAFLDNSKATLEKPFRAAALRQLVQDRLPAPPTSI